ncbi:MAG: DUF4920 domain-containing protein [Zunongwangia sp.]|jgi:hypothetical protein|uniref:DUF4920 domain-containing protein n=1 Tax=Zunongwangia profunda TaxID=398743 RepID=A0A3D5J263_9FLAO|nr:DUF4920 domain-containing protein [Zunongwangia profunda]MAG87717.1 DUF4920 domain-containing protein [Flavobacteriaceae bacterium]MAO38491.1 DUF4920 domain-containing protein [Zunongwangia sp.]MAS71811.1 DUF4920 domain-containing protein [Zunongwangia sp.]MCC4228745.1 DUF4920 domain-containing protein [Zunongwangia profunda]HAJ80873.1 DUF4920 domain-containing protein [Zunongwangia profunda]|tara:strand:+ start:255 stop:764 length:510 start_codon:yes stop_codon:yes gene_type:complete
MKKIIFSIVLCCALIGCKNSEEKQETVKTSTSNEELAYARFGDDVDTEAAIDANTMANQYAQLKPGDTITTSFTTTVNSVCKMKGCWMNLEIPGDEDVSVKFKDYGFFVPKDIEGKQVVVEGKAFLKEVSVKDQQHFAEDAGKSAQEIAAITEPKQELAFLANGVLLKQ